MLLIIAFLLLFGSTLNDQVDLGLSTIRRIEGCDGLLETASVKILQSIQKTLEAGGVEFIGTSEEGPGVRLKLKRKLFAKKTSNGALIDYDQLISRTLVGVGRR